VHKDSKPGAAAARNTRSDMNADYVPRGDIIAASLNKIVSARSDDGPVLKKGRKSKSRDHVYVTSRIHGIFRPPTALSESRSRLLLVVTITAFFPSTSTRHDHGSFPLTITSP
jgi:hypothetical protein